MLQGSCLFLSYARLSPVTIRWLLVSGYISAFRKGGQTYTKYQTIAVCSFKSKVCTPIWQVTSYTDGETNYWRVYFYFTVFQPEPHLVYSL